MTNKIPISLEFFPHRDEATKQKLLSTAQSLKVLNPEYVSVTFGAGGSTRSGTVEAVEMLGQNGFDAAPHLSCIGSTQYDLKQLLDKYKTMGVKRIVALRGDMPSGMGIVSGDFDYANQLVSFIREYTGDYFHLEVAAYPETHPQATSPQADLQYFINKVNAGANAAITQYFFNDYAYYDFVDQLAAKGVDTPIVPGIMPITNFKQLQRFSNMCGAEIPKWLLNRLQGFGDDIESIKEFGTDFISNLCQRLIDNGVPSLHFYTLNNHKPTLDICENLGLVEGSNQLRTVAQA